MLLCATVPAFAAGAETYISELRLIYAEDYEEAKEILEESEFSDYKLYKKNLNNYIFYRKFIMTYPNATLWHRYRFAIHYVAESLLAKNIHFLRESPRKLLTLAAIPGGLLLYVYLYIYG